MNGMIKEHTCPHCKRDGRVYIPYVKPENTILICYCGEKVDIGYMYNTYKNIGDMEREEYERLNKIYGRETE